MAEETSPKSMPDHEEGAVVLKCTADEFKKFISSLLGKPQTIGKMFRGSFDIGLREIEDIHHLINQRICQQNDNKLIQFTSRIVFDDSSSVLINSIEDLLVYKEVRPIASIQIHLTWEYLVNFQDRHGPEKQEIEVSFLTRTHEHFPMIEDDETIFITSHRQLMAGIVTFRIRHTARTWGADIEALLSGHIKNILQKPSKLRQFIWRHSGKISFAVAALFFTAAVVMSFLTASHIRKLQQTKVAQFLEQKTLVEEKINFILTSAADGVWPTYFFSVIVFLLCSLAVAILIGIWVESTADTDKPGFIVLTHEAEKQKKRILKRYDRKGTLFILSLITSVCAGVLANIVFHVFWQNK